MLVANDLDRVFIFKDNNETLELNDPNINWDADEVLNFYSNNYPTLTTANVIGPIINNDRIEYKFETFLGTKG